MRRGCSVVLYDHTEYTRTRAFQTLRASLWDHVSTLQQQLPQACHHASASLACARLLPCRAHPAHLPSSQVASGYLLKPDVEEIMVRIGVAQTLEELLEKSEVVVESVFEDATLKKELFNNMCEILKQRAVPPDQITLCSNTMSLPMQAIVEDIQLKEYRGSCVGMRFLHPVWFIDEVELNDCDYTRRATCNHAEKLLKQLYFQPFFFDGCYRRKLTLQEISTYQSRQRLRCPEPMKSLPKRGLRKKPFGSPSGSTGDRSTPPPSPEVSVGAATSAEPPPPAEDAEPCAVCLEEPRSALLVPCGHMAMCVECADKVLHGSRPICVVCRQPIEKILRATPPP